MDEPRSAESVACSLCGTAAQHPPSSWMYEVHGDRGGRRYCPECSRRNVRAVEARLDPEWW